MKKLKNLYISIYYILSVLFLMNLTSSCTTPKDSNLDSQDLAVSYDFSNGLNIYYDNELIDLDSVSDETKQKFYHNENLYQKNLNSIFKDIVVEKYIWELSKNDNIDLESAKSKAYSSLGFSYLGLNDIEKKEELFKKILEQKQVVFNLQRINYPTINLDTKDFPRIKELPKTSNNTDDTNDSNNTLSIVVYTSLSCSKCKTAYTWLKELSLDSNYKDRLEIVYKSLPLSDLDFLVQFEKGAICSYKQAHFNEYIDYVYEHISDLSDLTPQGVTASIQGIDANAFSECLSQKSEQLDISTKEAENLGIYNTPSFFINNRLYPQISSLKELKDILDEI